jgi:hypothetical protein
LCRAGADRDALFRALLRRIGGPTGLRVVVLEDIHWADEATLDLLRYLGRRLPGTSVLLIVTYRDDELTTDDPLRSTLGDLARLPSTRRIELAPLSEPAVLARAARLTLQSRDLLDTAAVTGTRVELRLLKAAGAGHRRRTGTGRRSRYPGQA